MTEVDDVTAAAIAVCATRLDAAVSAQEFVDLVDLLIQRVRRECLQSARDDDRDDDDPPDDPEEPAQKPRPLAPAPLPRGKGPKSVSHDTKVLLRRKYDQAIDGRQRAPRGFLEGLAVEHNLPLKVVKAICWRKDGT